MDQQRLTVAFWILLAVVLIAVFLLVRQRRTTRALQVRAEAAEAWARTRAEEERHLVDARLPALAESLSHRPVEVPGPRNPQAVEGDERVLALFADSVRQATARGEQSARATLKSMMRAVQSLSNEQQVAISAMQNRHDDPDVLAGLMRIDHMNSQLNRRAQATAVLCGSWPGQQRSASALTDVVRGATSRIRDYLRINVPAESDVAVISRAVEPVVLAVAELLDNGARHSPPTTSVEVNFQQAHNGMVVMIDDGGVGMTVEELQRAARLLAGDGGSDINRLGDPPQVGFAVIGVLAKRYGFRVSVDTRSPYGGVRAVVFLPTELLTRVSKPTMPDNAVALSPERQPRPAPAVDDAVLGRTPGGLPRRRRTQPVDQGPPPSAPATQAPAAPAAHLPSAAAPAAAAPAHSAPAAAAHSPAAPALSAPAPAAPAATAHSPAAPTPAAPAPAGPAAAHSPVAHAAATPSPAAPDPVGRSTVDQRIATGLAAWKRGTDSGRATTPPPVAEGNTPA